MKSLFAVSVAAVLLAGCAGPNAWTNNTLLGAGVGGVAGAAISGTPLGLAAGALGGGLIGSQIKR